MKVISRLCDEYTLEAIQPIIHEMLSSIDLEPNSKVLLKPNLLRQASPEKAVTTHPLIVQAAAAFFTERGHQVTIADSPGGPALISLLKGIYQASGLTQAAENSQAILNEDLSSVDIDFPQAKRLQHFPILRVIDEADVVINLAKLKTHGMMTYTGAVKNLFGVIPGLQKANHHLKLQEKMNFAHHLVDVCEYIKPAYSIIDAIEAMEGNGPGSGTPKHVGAILGSADPYALDAVAIKLAGIPKDIVPTYQAALSRGLITPYELVGSLPEVEPFRLPRSVEINGMPKWVSPKLAKTVTDLIKARPDFDHTRCIRCKKCQEICPPQIISLSEDGYPSPDLSRCISCFCCHEVCPVDAIRIRKSLLARLFQRENV